ncbi:MAG: hypothetical protein OEW99_00475 [Gammaproteobacteria bacterium]|nr:hypothetical protein [Gammaproteobacteria bacterium]
MILFLLIDGVQKAINKDATKIKIKYDRGIDIIKAQEKYIDSNLVETNRPIKTANVIAITLSIFFSNILIETVSM